MALYHRLPAAGYYDKIKYLATVREIIRAGCYAPNNLNNQPWGFVVIKDRKSMKMVLGRSDADFPQIDCSLAAENMVLAARSLGIGSCWIGLAMPLGNDRRILTEIGVPSEYNLVAPLIFGYPTKMDQTASPRNEDIFQKWIT